MRSLTFGFTGMSSRVLICLMSWFVGTAGEEDSVSRFSLAQEGILSVSSVKIDTLSGVGGVYVVRALNKNGNGENLQVSSDGNNGFVVVERTNAVLGMSIYIEEGIEFDKEQMVLSLQDHYKALAVEGDPRFIAVTSMQSIEHGKVEFLVGQGRRYNMIIQTVDGNGGLTRHFYYWDGENGRISIEKIGSWRAVSIR